MARFVIAPALLKRKKNKRFFDDSESSEQYENVDQGTFGQAGSDTDVSTFNTWEPVNQSVSVLVCLREFVLMC